MTNNNIRTATANIVRQLINPEIPTSDVRECVSILRDAIRTRQFITNAENAHSVLMAAMTGDGVSVYSACQIVADYNLASERALHEISHSDEKLGEFESAIEVDVDCERPTMRKLDSLIDEVLGELNK